MRPNWSHSRALLSTGRGAPRTSVPAYCCHNRCLQHGLGRYMQRAGSLGALDRARLLWHINCLELWAVHLALRQFRPLLLGKHVLVRTDNTAAVSYINRLGGIRSHRMSQLARHLLLWSHTQFKSLRAVHIPGKLNRAADALSRQLTFPGEWRLHPETIRLIWSRFGEAQVDLFASPESSHCQLYFSLTEGPLGTDALAHSWPRALRKYAFPPVSLLAQTLCKLREDEEQVLLVAPHWPTRTWFPELISFATAPPSAPYGTRVQIYGTSMCGSWTGRGRLEWSTTGGGRPWARRTGRCHACCAIPPHPGIRAPFSPPVQFPGW